MRRCTGAMRWQRSAPHSASWVQKLGRESLKFTASWDTKKLLLLHEYEVKTWAEDRSCPCIKRFLEYIAGMNPGKSMSCWTLLMCTALLAVNLVKAGTPLSDFLEVIRKQLFQLGDDQSNCERRLRISGGGAFAFVCNETIITLGCSRHGVARSIGSQ